MDQQEQRGGDGGEPSTADQQDQQRSDQQERRWGEGAASALDNLRRQNFRGRRPMPGDARPSSD